MAGLLDLIQERQQRPTRPSIAGLLEQVGTYPGENLASMARQHIAAIPQKFAQNQAYQMGLLEKAFPGNTYESMMTQGDPRALAELGMQAPFNAMIAYHGTPHNILGKFDISKVGTGEGAQAYGHGMYFAENPAVAKEYQTALSKKSPEAVKYMNELSKSEDKASQVAATTLQNFDHPNQAIDELKASLKNKNTPKEYVPIYESAIKKLENTPVSGNLYKVDIPDEYIPNMLDWDKPFNQQPKGVKQLIDEAVSNENFDPFEYLALAGATKQHPRSKEYVPTGQEILNDLSTLYGIERNSPEFSQLLQEKGIKGISYLDADSRTGKIASNGTRNFVIFDPTDVKILEKNSQKVEGLLE